MKISDIQFKEVYTKNGNSLGRVYDIEGMFSLSHHKISTNLVITSLICGRRSILERLGIRKHQGKKIPWERVVMVKEDRIIVA